MLEGHSTGVDRQSRMGLIFISSFGVVFSCVYFLHCVLDVSVHSLCVYFSSEGSQPSVAC